MCVCVCAGTLSYLFNTCYVLLELVNGLGIGLGIGLGVIGFVTGLVIGLVIGSVIVLLCKVSKYLHTSVHTYCE